MTFDKFEEIVKKHKPEIEVTSHGFHTSKVNIGVVFKKGGRAYSYSGSYCDVLNRIGIKAITKGRYNQYMNILKNYKENNGKPCLFGTFNYDKDIGRIESEIKRFDTEFEII